MTGRESTSNAERDGIGLLDRDTKGAGVGRREAEGPGSALLTENTPLPATGEGAPDLRALTTAANLLTLSRAGLAVVVFALITAERHAWALAVFAVAALTDYLDGVIARRLGQTSALGRQLDPLVDKVLVIGVFIFLLATPGSGLAAWMVTLVVLRELLIQALRGVMEGAGHAFGARWAGKLKTTSQFLAIVVILWHLSVSNTDDPARTGYPWTALARDLSIWAAVALTAYSGVSYLVAAWSMTRRGT